jgi:hypothetical protein
VGFCSDDDDDDGDGVDKPSNPIIPARHGWMAKNRNKVAGELFMLYH